MWNEKIMCEECDAVYSSCDRLINKYNEEENDRSETQFDKLTCAKERENKKVKVEDEKEIRLVRLFSANYNGFGSCSESKINQIKEMSMVRNMDGLVISSSDVRWKAKNETNMVHRLKNMNKKVTISTSDSGEEVDHSRWFLKGGTITALWISAFNCVEVDSMCEQECGWCNAVVVTGNREKVALIKVHVAVHANSRGVNSSKEQCKRTIGKSMSVISIRNK